MCIRVSDVKGKKGAVTDIENKGKTRRSEKREICKKKRTKQI